MKFKYFTFEGSALWFRRKNADAPPEKSKPILKAKCVHFSFGQTILWSPGIVMQNVFRLGMYIMLVKGVKSHQVFQILSKSLKWTKLLFAKLYYLCKQKKCLIIISFIFWGWQGFENTFWDLANFKRDWACGTCKIVHWKSTHHQRPLRFCNQHFLEHSQSYHVTIFFQRVIFSTYNN